MDETTSRPSSCPAPTTPGRGSTARYETEAGNRPSAHCARDQALPLPSPSPGPGLTPRPSRGRDFGNSSVRAIVNWLEGTRNEASVHDEQGSRNPRGEREVVKTPRRVTTGSLGGEKEEDGDGDGEESADTAMATPSPPPPPRYQQMKYAPSLLQSSSSSSAAAARPHDGGHGKPGPTRQSARSSPTPLPPGPPALPGAGRQQMVTQMREVAADPYSLTLLKFKSYFNNRPLGRCLDEAASGLLDPARGEGEGSGKAAAVPSEKKRGEPGVRRAVTDGQGEEKALGGGTWKEKSKGLNHKRSISLQKLDKLMQELSQISGSAAAAVAPPPVPPLPIEEDPPRRRPPRIPADVSAYWEGVRASLWISDSEMDCPSSCQYPPRSDARLEEDQLVAAFPDLHHRADSPPSASSFLLGVADALPLIPRLSPLLPPPLFSQSAAGDCAIAQPSTSTSTGRRARADTTQQQQQQGCDSGSRTSGRRRKLTAEEKMAEVDEFLNHQSRRPDARRSEKHSDEGPGDGLATD